MAIRMPFPADAHPEKQHAQMPDLFSLFLWILAALLLLGCLALSNCSGAQAREPMASPHEPRRLAANEFACPGMHAEWEGATVRCFKEKP